MDKLLKEAIDDAKAVRATAFANAKLALEEAFTPKIQSMLSAKLRNEMEGEEDEVNVGYEDTNQDEVDPTTEAVDVTADAGKDPEKEKGSAVGTDSGSPDAEKAQEKLTENDEEGEEEGEEEWTPEAPGVTEEEGEEVDELPVDDDSLTAEAEDIPVDGEDDLEVTDNGDFSSEDDAELESIIRELEAEEEPSVEEPVFDDEDEAPVEEATDVTADAGKDPEKEKGSAVGPDSGSDDAEKAQEKLTENEEEEEGEENEELDLEALVKEINEELEDEEEKEDEKLETENLRTENKKLAKSLKEHRSVVKFLKDRLVEINLLNAKLLYSNKLFRTYSLTESQKKGIIETIDRANSAREVKLLYTALHESLKVKKSSLKENSVPKKKVLGSASKVSASTKPKNNINESTDLKARFQKLAQVSSGISRFV